MPSSDDSGSATTLRAGDGGTWDTRVNNNHSHTARDGLTCTAELTHSVFFNEHGVGLLKIYLPAGWRGPSGEPW